SSSRSTRRGSSRPPCGSSKTAVGCSARTPGACGGRAPPGGGDEPAVRKRRSARAPPREGGNMSDDRRPIGYWLKHLDRLLEQTFERTLEAEHLTRRHWQVLNTLIAGPTANRSLAAALEPCIGDQPTALNGGMNDLLRRRRGLQRRDGEFEPSAGGRCRHPRGLEK